MSAVEGGAEQHARENEDRLATLLAAVREQAVVQETARRLLHEEVRGLADLGFGAARLPRAQGGAGLSLEELFAQIIRISAADANLGHVWRGHIAFVESLLSEGVDSPRAQRWLPRLLRGEVIGNAQSEKRELAELGTVLERDGDRLLLTGVKFYTTGSIYADWIHLAALDGDQRVALTVSAHADGVEIVDDWDGFGQPLTGSGTTRFDRVEVDPVDVVESGEDIARWHHLGSVFQLSLLAVVAGIVQRAHEDTIAFVQPRRRTFGFAGEVPPREDPLVQEVVGSLGGAASAVRRIVLSLARELEAAVSEGSEDTEVSEDTAATLQELQLEVFRAQRVVLELALDATTRLFEVGGASAVSRDLALDRHWRNVRTIASHNPTVQRTRAVGQFDLLGTLPEWRAPGAPERVENGEGS